MAKGSKNKALRIIVGIFAVIIVLALGASIWLSQHYKAVIKTKLPGWVAKSTDSLYNIKLEDIDINIITRKVTINKVQLWPDTVQLQRLQQRDEAPGMLYVVNVPKIVLSGIAWENLITDKSFDCKHLSVAYPEITVKSLDIRKDSATQTKTDTAQRANKMVETVSVERLEIVSANVIYQKEDTPLCRLKGANLLLEKWAYNSAEPDTNKLFFAEKTTINVDSFILKKSGGLYNIQTGNLAFASNNNKFILNNLHIGAAMSREDFYKKVGSQKEIYTLDFPSIVFSGLDIKKLIDDKMLVASDIEISDPSLDIFFSRMYAPNNKSKVGNYPHQMLRKMPFDINIASVKLKNGNFKYTEVNSKTQRAGSLLFNNISGNLKNVTNMDTIIALNSHCIIALQGNFMRSSPMKATFDLYLADEKGYFTVDGYLKNLEGSQISETAKALASAEIKSMHLDNLDLHVAGNENHAQGKFTLLYRDLNVVLNKVEDDKGMHQQKFLSFIANNLILYPSNPMPGKEVRTVTTELERDPYKSFFSLIWKNIYMGAQKTALRNEKLAELGKKDKDGKKPSVIKTLFGKTEKKENKSKKK